MRVQIIQILMAVMLLIVITGCVAIQKQTEATTQEPTENVNEQVEQVPIEEPASDLKEEPAGVVVEELVVQEPTQVEEPTSETEENTSVKTYKDKELTGSRIHADENQQILSQERKSGQVRSVEGTNLDRGEIRTETGKVYKFKGVPGLKYGQKVEFDVQLIEDIYYAVNVKLTVQEQYKTYRP